MPGAEGLKGYQLSLSYRGMIVSMITRGKYKHVHDYTLYIYIFIYIHVYI